ncbi:DUF1653 domain-containing protein [Aetokthonos hydrillicola]|jgi:hypothetical protein|uniref:DUF1653 domain-containing protein n=1 Tax=Aetokthonos hydrillicola TaxID=1550245 RepID=UPI002877C993|nr:DUF1653 domain-containing protein [Aetokthonos hydrillicola]
MLPDRTIQKHQIYRHYKGALYAILELPINPETNEVMVVYAGSSGVWVRSITDFGAVLGSKETGHFCRFKLVECESSSGLSDSFSLEK